MNTNQNNPRIVELIINEEIGDIVDVVSIVDHPAIELDFMKFSQTDEKIKFKIEDEEQRLVSGPVMLHSKYIYRYDMFSDEEYYVYFSKETVKKAMNMFMKMGSTKKTNLNHNSEFFDGVTVVESWIDGERAKSLYYDLEPGNWFATFHVENDEVWQAIKDGIYKGFSLEGFFSNITKLRKESAIESELMKIVNSDKSEYQKKIELLNFVGKIKLED
jgi:hypothetical protein